MLRLSHCVPPYVQHNTSWTVKGLAADTYYWSVQAVDTGFMGGAWAGEEMVTVP